MGTFIAGGLVLAGCGVETASARSPIPGEATAATAAVVRRADPAAATIDFRSLAGRWTVTGVAVVGGGVQAFVDDDPAYMGRTVVVGPRSLSWDTGMPAGPATLGDRCAGPVVARLAGVPARVYATRFRSALTRFAAAAAVGSAHAVECIDGNWGPEAAGGSILFPIDANQLAMSWYDNVVLRLRRPPG